MTDTLAAPQTVPQHERRDITLLSAGTIVSVTGDSAAAIALLLEVRHAGPAWVAAVLAAEFIPFVLLASPAGRLVDRVDNRRLLVAALAAQAAVAIPLAFARTSWAIVALVFALGAVTTVVRPAVNAMIPVLTGEERAKSGYAWVATGTGIGWIIGPALGGLLTTAFGVTSALLADAGSFLVLAIACSFLSATRGRTAHDGEKPDKQHGGFTIMWRDRLLRWSILVTAVVVACAVVDNVAAPFRFVNQLGTTPVAYGLYLTLWAVGAIGGSQLARRLPTGAMPVNLALANMVCGLGILGIGLAPSVAIAFAASVVGGIGNGVANVSVSVLVSGRTKPDERGRVFATVGGITQAAVGTGTIAAAPLVATLHAGHAMALAGATSAVLAAITAGWTAFLLRGRPGPSGLLGQDPV